EEIPAVEIGAEPVFGGGAPRAVLQVLLVEGVGDEKGPGDAEEDDPPEHRGSGDRHAVLFQPAPGVAPKGGSLDFLQLGSSDRDRRRHSYLTRGSRMPSTTSTTRFATRRKTALTTTTAMARVMSRLIAASTK